MKNRVRVMVQDMYLFQENLYTKYHVQVLLKRQIIVQVEKKGVECVQT